MEIIEIKYNELDKDELEELEVKENLKQTSGKPTMEKVKAQGGGYIKGLHRQVRDGKTIGYVATFCYGYSWVEDDKGNKKRKQDKERKSFTTKKEAMAWLAKQANLKAEAEKKGIALKKSGYTVSQVCDDFHDYLVKMERDEGYIHDHDVRMNHFRQFFVRDDNKYVSKIDTAQIQEYLDWERTRTLQNGKIGMCESSIIKYKSTLKMIWDFMLRNRYKYMVDFNVVENAVVLSKPSEFESIALYYWEIEELAKDLCNYFDDPTYLFMLIMAYTQDLRRGEQAGLKWGDIDWNTKRIHITHNRVQRPKKSNGGKKNTDKNNVKLPKNEKKRWIELHKAGYDCLKLYKEWQEEKLGRPVKDDEFVLMFEINLKYGYLCDAGKISRKWIEMYNKVNKLRKRARKDEIRQARLHDGRETYATLLLHGVRKKDGTIIPAADSRQVYDSMGHKPPRETQNTTEIVYNKGTSDRWSITEFWDSLLDIDVYNEWATQQQIRQMEYEMMSEFEKEESARKKQARMEKAKRERDANKREDDIIIEYK